MKGKGEYLRGASNGVNSSTCIGQTLTDTGFISHCFKEWFTGFFTDISVLRCYACILEVGIVYILHFNHI